MKTNVKINITKGTITDFIAHNTRLNLKELIEKAVIRLLKSAECSITETESVRK